jgi:hypothetical protein
MQIVSDESISLRLLAHRQAKSDVHASAGHFEVVDALWRDTAGGHPGAGPMHCRRRQVLISAGHRAARGSYRSGVAEATSLSRFQMPCDIAVFFAVRVT